MLKTLENRPQLLGGVITYDTYDGELGMTGISTHCRNYTPVSTYFSSA